MMANSSAEPPSPQEWAALSERFPAEEFPYLREAALCAPDFLGSDFEFGIRALARGLLASARNETC